MDEIDVSDLSPAAASVEIWGHLRVCANRSPKEVVAAFRDLDSHATGRLDAAAFNSLIKVFGVRGVSAEAVAATMRLGDRKARGSIDYQEFMATLQQTGSSATSPLQASPPKAAGPVFRGQRFGSGERAARNGAAVSPDDANDQSPEAADAATPGARELLERIAELEDQVRAFVLRKRPFP